MLVDLHSLTTQKWELNLIQHLFNMQKSVNQQHVRKWITFLALDYASLFIHFTLFLLQPFRSLTKFGLWTSEENWHPFNSSYRKVMMSWLMSKLFQFKFSTVFEESSLTRNTLKNMFCFERIFHILFFNSYGAKK